MKIQKQIKQKKLAVVDFETTGLTPYKGSRIFAYAIGFINLGFVNEVERIDYIVKRIDNENEKENKENLDYLKGFFLDTSIIKIGHNIKFELSFCQVHNIFIPPSTIWHDTMLMSQILNNLWLSHGLDNLTYDLCGYTKEIDKKIKQQFKLLGNYQLIDKQLMYDYQLTDIERTALLYFTFKNHIYKDRKTLENYLIEIEVVKITQHEESHGICLHKYKIKQLRKWLEDEIDKVGKSSYLLLNEYVNLNSDETIRRLLYRKYKMPILAFTDGGLPSTDKDVLSTLQIQSEHNIFELILKQRSYTKGLATLKSFEKYGGDELIIYPNLNTCATRTSRKSSSNPNLQNVSTEAAEKNPYPVPLRKCIIPPAGYVFIVSDYKGIELRLIVNDTKEPELFNMLMQDADADLHIPTMECFMMEKVYIIKNDSIFMQGVNKVKQLEKIDKKRFSVLRKVYKNTGFCVAYGGGDQKVALTLGKKYEEIKIGALNYRRRFDSINNFTKRTIEEVKKNGFITTVFGLKRSVPIDKPYIGANYRIQATAAGILKRGQIKVDNFLNKNKSLRDIKLVLDVHDENIYKFPKYLLNRKDEILPYMYSAMIDMPEVEVPLRVESFICVNNWNDKETLEVKYV